MRESTFIDRNKNRWEDIELEVEDEASNPDESASRFIDLVNDLSYTQTHYPHSKITTYLNFLASRVYKSIYFNQKKDKNPIIDFWKKDFPLIIGHNKKVLWVALAFFATFSTLGFICSFLEPDFIEGILGQNYVEMTEENIRKGIPFNVYSSKTPVEMFLQILANNLLVGLMLYMSGFLLGIGAVYNTFRNGVMFGAFMSLFIKNNLGADAVFIIMLHGTFELMGLVLECMAGLILGLSFLFPHTLTRKQAFRKGLAESAKIYIGTVPFTFVAALIESFITYLGRGGLQHSNVFVLLALSLIFIGSWSMVVWYFFIYSRNMTLQIPYEKYLKTFIA